MLEVIAPEVKSAESDCYRWQVGSTLRHGGSLAHPAFHPNGTMSLARWQGGGISRRMDSLAFK